MPTGLSPEEALPGFSAAFDEEEMRGRLQEALFGGREYVVERCTPTRPLYAPGEWCLVRYRVRASGPRGEPLAARLTGRVLPDESACAAYVSERLEPLVARMLGRDEVAPYAAPAFSIEPLHMAVQVWPVAAELPTLVEATDRARVAKLLRVEDCDVELVSYRRRGRCVLRYSSAREGLTAYGKVSAVGSETPKDAIIEALRRVVGDRVTIPRSLGWWPELRLSVLEAVPGEPRIGAALDAGAPSLLDLIEACGEAAVALHTSRVTLGPARTMRDELAELARELAPMHGFVPELADRLRWSLDRIAALADESEPLEPCLCHGDFKHEQLLFDGRRSALVDYDGLCQAEPALDLGKFLAHLRLARPNVEDLAEEFLRAYRSDDARLRTRTALYEAVALVRLTLRSAQDLDEARTQATATVLEERMSVLAPEGDQG